MPLSAGGFADLGSAASSIFGAAGSAASAKGLSKAAVFAGQNAEIAAQSTRIQQTMAQRQITQTLGGQRADVAGSGLAASGSALDLMRDSAQQGALTKQLISAQGAISVNGYQAEQASYEAQASAAKASSAGGLLKGALDIGSALIAFSDDRMKEDIRLVERRRDGLGLYDFRYKGSPAVFRGVLASEVERLYPSAISWVDGMRAVNYSLIQVTPEVVNA